jgi:protein-tyrosine-phosphatase
MKQVLFVCVENSCRSQMAEAFAKIHGKGLSEVYSAGSRASGKVNEKAIKSMKEVEYDYAIIMGCWDECPYVKAKQRQNWAILDPKNMNDQNFNEVRDIIEKKVLSLINEVNAK